MGKVSQETVRSLERLEQGGYRITGPRMAVLAAIRSLRNHFTAEELCRRLPGVGRATVYRTVKLFAAQGVLCRVLMDDGSLRYRLSNRGHHHHLVCLSCGRVQDFSDRDLGQVVDAVAGRARFIMEGHWLEIFGRCRKCQGSESQSF